MFTNSCVCVTQSEAIITVSTNTSFSSFSPFYKRVEEKGKKQGIKGKTMAKWMKLFWNNSFVN